MNWSFRAAALAALVALAAPAFAQDLRIDTEIFVGDEKQPSAEMLTLFANGLIYDFMLGQPEEVTLLDTVRGRFTLLDSGRRVKCSIDTREVLEYALALGTHAAEAKDPLFAFAARPQFESKIEEYEENGQQLVRLTLTGKPLEYAVVARHPDRPEVARTLRHFADWYARLNAMRPGNLPPAARMELNRALADRDLIPVEITRTFPASSPLSRSIVVKSRHLLNGSLSGEDRKKIDRAGTYLAEFQAVSFDQYRAPADKPATKTAAKTAAKGTGR